MPEFGLQPSGDAFRFVLEAGRLLSAAEIDEIAASDYGSDRDEHRRALKRIIAERRLPCPIEWVPREVLELTGWWHPVEGMTQKAVESLHRCRLFATSVLMLARVEQADHELFWAVDGVATGWVGSVVALGMQEKALGFLAHVATELSMGSEYDLSFLGIAAFGMACSVDAVRDDSILQVAEWTLSQPDPSKSVFGWPERRISFTQALPAMAAGRGPHVQEMAGILSLLAEG